MTSPHLHLTRPRPNVRLLSHYQVTFAPCWRDDHDFLIELMEGVEECVLTFRNTASLSPALSLSLLSKHAGYELD